MGIEDIESNTYKEEPEVQKQEWRVHGVVLASLKRDTYDVRLDSLNIPSQNVEVESGTYKLSFTEVVKAVTKEDARKILTNMCYGAANRMKEYSQPRISDTWVDTDYLWVEPVK